MARRRSGKQKTRSAEKPPEATSSAGPGSSVCEDVCRLCESHQGPFLNIFNGETPTKLDELLPFGISEADSLSHKICFRCSAKVEELFEFVQKCIKTQENLHTAKGKQWTPVPKPKTHRSLWEAKLNKSNISNDDVCNAVVKKAMAGMKNIPSGKKSSDEQAANVAPNVSARDSLNANTPKEEKANTSAVNDNTETSSEKRTTRATRSSMKQSDKPPTPPTKKLCNKKNIRSNLTAPQTCPDNTVSKINSSSEDEKKDSEKVETTEAKTKQKEQVKDFNIFDNVVRIKVNGVGILFQCELCNRNFLKEDILLAHWCAKHGTAKENNKKKVSLPEPEPPKVPNIKYINTNTKTSESIKKPEPDVVNNQNNPKEELTANSKDATRKYRPAPASKIKQANFNPFVSMPIMPIESMLHLASNEPVQPGIMVSSITCLDSRYKVVPGPHHTYSLIDSSSNSKNETSTKPKKRNAPEDDTIEQTDTKQPKLETKEEIIEFDDCDQEIPEEKPYPVGLIQKVSHHDFSEAGPSHSRHQNPVPFSTSAEKKQSYTVVQTSHPNKLLISARPPVAPDTKKEQMRGVQNRANTESAFNVTLEEVSRDTPKDAFFTFVDVDPLLSPLYVLPLDPELQESTVVPKVEPENDIYPCTMCDQKFSREPKLLAHIKAHYKEIDEQQQQQQVQTVNTVKKRRRKSIATGTPRCCK